jgi:hypothetical protein
MDAIPENLPLDPGFVHRLARALLRDRDLAADVAQDALVVALSPATSSICCSVRGGRMGRTSSSGARTPGSGVGSCARFDPDGHRASRANPTRLDFPDLIPGPPDQTGN